MSSLVRRILRAKWKENKKGTTFKEYRKLAKRGFKPPPEVTSETAALIDKKHKVKKR